MKDAVASGTGTSAKIPGQTVAGKTGTNSDQKGVFFSGLTGWYAGSVWIGHDNYKALSSKTTGGNSAAKLWRTFMSLIHEEKSLTGRNIMEGSFADYGLVRVTTCGVSGQIATNACKNDAAGYKTYTDYWPQASAPSTYCQMHTEATLCTVTGQLATAHCPGTQTAGVITIPQGHPLYRFLGTQYESTLEEYLGDFASLKLTGDANRNSALLAQKTCTKHTSSAASGPAGDPIVQYQLLPDAERLLASAQAQLAAMSESDNGYAILKNAISSLMSVIVSSPDAAMLTQAMSYLTQAMANAR